MSEKKCFVQQLTLAMNADYIEDVRAFIDLDILKTKIQLLDEVIEILLDAEVGVAVCPEPDTIVEVERLKYDLKKMRQALILPYEDEEGYEDTDKE